MKRSLFIQLAELPTPMPRYFQVHYSEMVNPISLDTAASILRSRS